MKGKNGTSRARRRLGAVMTASLLSLSMVFGSVPGTVFAADGDETASVLDADGGETENIPAETLGETGVSPSGSWSISESADDKGFYESTFGSTSLVFYSKTKPTGPNGLSETVDGETVTIGVLSNTPPEEDKTIDNGGVDQGVIDASKNHLKFTASGKGTAEFYFGYPKDKVIAVNKIESDESVTVLGYAGCATVEAGKTATKEDNDTLGQVKLSNGAGPKITKVSFPIEKDAKYLIALNGSKIKPGGLSESLAATYTGNIDLGGQTLPDGWGLKFTNVKDESVSVADVDKTALTYEVQLEEGEYKASLTDAKGYSVTAATRAATFDKSHQTHNIAVEASAEYKLSGTLSPADELKAYAHVGDIALNFVPKDKDTYETVKADFNKDTLSYTANLACSSEYTLTLDGAYDYEVKSTTAVAEKASSDDAVLDVTLSKRATYAVSGKYIGLTQVRGEYETLNVSPTSVIFADVEHKGYEYEATLAKSGWTAELRDGSYQAVISAEGWSTTTHVIVKGAALEKDLLLKDKSTSQAVDYSETVEVGKDKKYKTVQAAVDAIASMDRTGGQRVTIVLDPGVYREQVRIGTPNVTIQSKSGNKDDTKITWYYGIGYKYNSCVNSLYDPYADYDQFTEGDVVEHWGAAVNVAQTATGFRAQNITFENSFNKYMTEEEVKDGVKPNGRENINVQRTKDTDVTTKAATERAAALVNYADQTEFDNCGFIGSQDTLYTCNRPYDLYFRNCYIEGSTDFIYGDGNVIFDACEINICGYSDSASSSYLTANSNSVAGTKGYVFRSCLVTENGERMVSTENYFGRMWGSHAAVTFLNTRFQKADMMTSSGWKEMNGHNPTDATVTLVEYNSTCMGKPMDTASRVSGTVKDSVDMSAYTVAGVYGSRWTPSFAVGDVTTKPVLSKSLSMASNGDLNVPNPGETVTVGYEFSTDPGADDATQISWYAVDTDFDGSNLENMLKKATLLKTVISSVSGIAFQIPMACSGKNLGVVVSPLTCYGQAGDPSFYVNVGDSPVSNNWVEPGEDDPEEDEPGAGIGIYLAGDSTVKDYSPNGMYMKGANREEGAWGEFLPYFFDSRDVTVYDYAEGGRACRSFVNEGKLDKILENIKEGDFLFMQFGHNDCSNTSGNTEDRFVPLYTDKTRAQTVKGTDGFPASGFPVIKPEESMKTNTPASLVSKDGEKYYAWNCGATYKGFLQLYIDEALARGATPVIVTPVSRKKYDANGVIMTNKHHDAYDTYEPTLNYRTADNAYVTACRELYEENKKAKKNVLFMDAYAMTEEMFNKSYADNGADVGGDIMYDNTHCNKTGGMIEAAMVAKWIQESNTTIAGHVKRPASVQGIFGTTEYFSVDDRSNFKAYKKADHSEIAYWTSYGQALIDQAHWQITFEKAEGGTAHAEPAGASAGEKVFLVAEPDEGYVIESWHVTSGNAVIPVDEAGSWFTMPDGPVFVKPVFKKTALTLVVGATGVITAKPLGIGDTEVLTYTVDKDHKKNVKVANGVVTGLKATEPDSPAQVTVASDSGNAIVVPVTVIDPQSSEEALKPVSKPTAKVSAPKQLKLQWGPAAKKNTSKDVTVKVSGADLKSSSFITPEVLDAEGNADTEVVAVTEKDKAKKQYTVTAAGPGTAFIRWSASASEGGEVLAAFVTKVVVNQPVSKVNVSISGNILTSNDEVIMEIGQNIKFDAATDSPTDGGKITWSVKGGAAKVTKSGLVTATKASTGKTVTIIAKCGSVKSEAITIKVNDTAKYVLLSKPQIVVKKKPGKDAIVKLSAKTNPKNAKITWTSKEDYGKNFLVTSGKVTVKSKLEPGVYVVCAQISGSLVSECEIVVK